MAADALGLALLTYLQTGRFRRPTADGTMITPEPELAMKIAVIETFREDWDFAQRARLTHRQGREGGAPPAGMILMSSTNLPLLVGALAAKPWRRA
jgi:antitoxin HicB